MTTQYNVNCPGCQRFLVLAAGQAGGLVICPHCRVQFLAPTIGSAPAARPAQGAGQAPAPFAPRPVGPQNQAAPQYPAAPGYPAGPQYPTAPQYPGPAQAGAPYGRPVGQIPQPGFPAPGGPVAAAPMRPVRRRGNVAAGASYMAFAILAAVVAVGAVVGLAVYVSQRPEVKVVDTASDTRQARAFATERLKEFEMTLAAGHKIYRTGDEVEIRGDALDTRKRKHQFSATYQTGETWVQRSFRIDGVEF